MLNDSARILVRIRPCIGDPQSPAIRVGPWSNTLTIVDNVAPCDSEFVTGAFCDSISCGGVMVASTVLWNNQTGIVISSGYIQITLPEDMDIRAKAPGVSLYMGKFQDTLPPLPLTINAAGSRWVNARSYRCAISVPPYDYTHLQDSSGAYFNVSVAGCRDIAGNVIMAYGTDGEKAKTGVNMKDANDQAQGSASVIRRFWLCR
jgi:hypothetical protein